MSEARPISYEEVFELPSKRSDVFQALTDTAAVRAWLAEHAEIDARTGGCYAFWGRHTPNAGARADANARIASIDPGRGLVIDWHWGGVATRVSLTLADRGDACALTVVHECGREMDFCAPYTDHFFKDFWGMAVGNLRGYLKDGRAVIRPDFTDRAPAVLLSIEIDAPAATVWRCLSEPAVMDRWLSSAARVELRQGGVYSYGWTDSRRGDATVGPRKLITVEQGRVLEHDWTNVHEPETRVRWELTVLGPEKTRVTLTHYRPGEDPFKIGYRCGWARFLVLLGERAVGLVTSNRPPE